MSADNGVYVLETVRPVNYETYKLYRVAHTTAIDNFDYYKEKQPYNLGAYMKEIWGNSPVYEDKQEALMVAHEIVDNLPFCEYGVKVIKTDYVFYGDM
jgi:hypothetical protein